MRQFLPLLLLLPACGACKTGYATDWFRDETTIINPQLLRYGFDVQQSRCIGQKMSERMSRQELRDFQERAAAIRPAASVRLVPANLRTVANIAVRGELDRAVASCNTSFEAVAATEPVAAATPAEATAPATRGSRASPSSGDQPAPATRADGGTLVMTPMTALPPPDGGRSTPAPTGRIATDATPSATDQRAVAPAQTAEGATLVLTPMTALPPPDGRRSAPAPAARITWLNLGAADSGQSISIDAMSIEQAGASRIAWFRMTDPETNAVTNNLYRLRVDCSARTVQPLALRKVDEAGAQLSLREYVAGEVAAEAAEGGTVLEIAYLSLCT